MTVPEAVLAVGAFSFLVMLVRFLLVIRAERREQSLIPKPPRREPIWKDTPPPPEIQPQDNK